MLGILTENEIELILKDSMIGRIGCRDGDEIYIVPVTFIYVNDAAICHSFEGKKLTMMRKNPTVCFEVEQIADFRNWKCIIAKGRFEELNDTADIDMARQQLTEISLKHKTSFTPYSPAEVSASDNQAPQGISIFFKIHLGRISGRFEQAVTS